MGVKRSYLCFLLYVFLLCLTGCRQDKKQGITENVQVFRVGSNIYPPFAYFDDNGDAAGIGIDIAREAFGRLGYEIEFVEISWEDKKKLLESGAIDCICGCFSMDGRENDYRWTTPYMISKQVVAVNNKSDIKTLNDLSDKSIAVQVASTSEEILLQEERPYIPSDTQIISMENYAVQHASVDCGYVDALASDEGATIQYIKDYKADFRILEESLGITKVAFGFSKYDDSKIPDKVSHVLEEMKVDGSIERILSLYVEDVSQYLEIEDFE